MFHQNFESLAAFPCMSLDYTTLTSLVDRQQSLGELYFEL